MAQSIGPDPNFHYALPPRFRGAQGAAQGVGFTNAFNPVALGLFLRGTLQAIEQLNQGWNEFGGRVFPRSGWTSEGRVPFLDDAWWAVRGGGNWRQPPRPGGDPVVQPLYGVVINPNPQPKPDPVVQPLYGVVIDPNPQPRPEPPIQPLYGVVIDPNPQPKPQPPIQPLYGVVIDPRPKPDPVIQPLYGAVSARRHFG